MTGPMKWPNSVTGPTVILPTSARSVSLNLPWPSQSDLGTYNRERAEHFWPVEVQPRQQSPCLVHHERQIFIM